MWLLFAAVALIAALAQLGEPGFATIWDDALFFERTAYNVVHHGFAGWNQSDGPVFVNTSQLYQAVTVGLFLAAPKYFGAATIFWGWACLVAMFAVLLRGWSSLASSLVVFAVMTSPPVFFAMSTGMETALALLVLAAFFTRVLNREVLLAEQVAWQLLIFLVRPDALLLSMTCALVLSLFRGRSGLMSAARLSVAVALSLAALGLLFRAYYGTAVPLAFFVKTLPLSVYDAAYRALDVPGKMHNLAQVAVLCGPLVALGLLRRDKENIALWCAGGVGVAYHALSTLEIMGYHARFYAPALLAFAVSAIRGVSLKSPRSFGLVLVVGASVLVTVFGLRGGWLGNDSGLSPGRTEWPLYVAFFGCSLAVLLPPRAMVAGVFAMSPLVASSYFPHSIRIASDDESIQRMLRRSRSVVGMDRIARCFGQPLTLMHSELGIPGVVFLESRVTDYTGLANRDVTERRFDFEQVCRTERPEFIFRPHWTHAQLNESLNHSVCLAEEYVEAKLSRPSSCPLFVRKDLAAKFDACPPTN